jgi:hypothetical protein
MTEVAGAGAAAPGPQVRTVPGWAQRLLDAGVEPGAVQAAVDELAAPEPPPLSDEERAAAAQTAREEAARDHEAALAAAEHTRLQGESLIAHAAEQAAKAREDHDRALANADRIAAGEPAEGPPEQPAEPADDPGRLVPEPPGAAEGGDG